MTINRVQKSCLKLPGVALVDCVGGDHFNMSQLNSSAPYVERQECEIKEANSELLSKRDEVKKLGLGRVDGFLGLLNLQNCVKSQLVFDEQKTFHRTS